MAGHNSQASRNINEAHHVRDIEQQGEHQEIEHLPLDHRNRSEPCTDSKHVTNSVTKLICARHSARAFLPTPVPLDILDEVLQLAQHAPSNSNLQPWRLHILTGNALQRVSRELRKAAESGEQPTTQPIPELYKKYRSEMGHMLYGPEGYDVQRDDKEAMRAAQLRNYAFFEAPLGAIISMDESLAQVDALSVGMYLQTVCLLLAERGLGTCVAVSVVGYPHVLRRELGLPDHMVPLTGLAVGFEDEGKMLNKMRVRRDAHKECVTYVEV